MIKIMETETTQNRDMHADDGNQNELEQISIKKTLIETEEN